MPANKNIEDAAKAAKKKAEAQKAAYSQVKQNLNKKKIDYATAKKSAMPKPSKPVVKSSSGVAKTLPAVTGSKKGVRYAQ